MAVSTRDRKILWARAGNRCSMCHCELVQRGAETSADAVVGEECHIVSPRGGPRGVSPSDTSRKLDGYDNLMLLCPSDHSRIDQLVAEFTEQRLQRIKSAHEKWVQDTLDPPTSAPVVIKRAYPTALVEITDAATLISIVASAEESSYDHDELTSAADVDEVAGFVQVIHDYAELWDDLEPAERIRFTFDIGQLINDARANGWRIFGTRARGALSGGVSRTTSDWDTAYLRFVRADSPEILRIDPIDRSP